MSGVFKLLEDGLTLSDYHVKKEDSIALLSSRKQLEGGPTALSDYNIQKDFVVFSFLMGLRELKF